MVCLMRSGERASLLLLRPAERAGLLLLGRYRSGTGPASAPRWLRWRRLAWRYSRLLGLGLHLVFSLLGLLSRRGLIDHTERLGQEPLHGG